jgi:hypothetical protein
LKYSRRVAESLLLYLSFSLPLSRQGESYTIGRAAAATVVAMTQQLQQQQQ